MVDSYAQFMTQYLSCAADRVGKPRIHYIRLRLAGSLLQGRVSGRCLTYGLLLFTSCIEVLMLGAFSEYETSNIDPDLQNSLLLDVNSG